MKIALLLALLRRGQSLKPGANDVSRLSPGVYFVRPASGVMRDASSVTKTVVTKWGLTT
ncbi:MAG TPA: hypothetical protein VMH22_10125 [bacterium]|nr:hypothetical protein [bacterium]